MCIRHRVPSILRCVTFQRRRSHICPDGDGFSNLDSLTDPTMITMTDGSEVEAQGVKTVRMQLETGEVTSTL